MSDIAQNARIASIGRLHVPDLVRIGDETNLSPWSGDSYLAEMLNPAAIMLRLVSDENETVGFVVGRLIAGGEVEIRKEAEIYNIAVTRQSQGKGLGQCLLDEFIARASEKGAVAIWLEVRESNQTAIDFYRKNGFEHVQTRPNFYSNPSENALLMRLALAKQKS